MTLREAVDRYIAWQRDHGAKFRSSAETLDTFCRQAGEESDCDTVDKDDIRRFLAGKGYISMTPDLLDEASRRFERYVEHNLSPDAGQHRKGGTSHA